METTIPICSRCKAPCRRLVDGTAGKHLFRPGNSFLKRPCPGAGKPVQIAPNPLSVTCYFCTATPGHVCIRRGARTASPAKHPHRVRISDAQRLVEHSEIRSTNGWRKIGPSEMRERLP